jgi:uncharacterized protein YndB with AHSA1/START domain
VGSGDAERAPDIEATGLVRAEPEDVFQFLSDLRNHWRVADPFVDVLTLNAPGGGEPGGGTVCIRGPFGIKRIATTKVVASRAPRLIIGTAEIGEGTRARVSWTLAGRLGDTRVRLAAEIDHATAFDRVLLALGGNRWLTRRFSGALDRLAREMEGRSGLVPVDRAGDDHVAAERPA